MHLSEKERLREFGLFMFSVLLQDSDTEELEQHLADGLSPIAIRDIQPEVGFELDSVFEACVHPDPKIGYTGMDQLTADLDRIAAGERPRSHQPTKGWLANVVSRFIK